MSTGQVWTAPDGENFVEAGTEPDDESGEMTRFFSLTHMGRLLRANQQAIAERGLVLDPRVNIGASQATQLWDAMAKLPVIGDEKPAPVVDLDEGQPYRKEQVEDGAWALWLAFPTLHEDFTFDWFRKAARIVLEAAK